ncbi:MAG: hypothetical protein ACK5Q5_17520 [Planctomycetaceae bacterium]
MGTPKRMAVAMLAGNGSRYNSTPRHGRLVRRTGGLLLPPLVAASDGGLVPECRPIYPARGSE